MTKLKQIICITALVFLSGCASTDEWTRQDTWVQVGITAVIAADAYTTSKIQYHGGQEANPVGRKLLGRQPGTKETYLYLSTWALTNYLISRALPEKARAYWQGVTFGGHSIAVMINCGEGLCP